MNKVETRVEAIFNVKESSLLSEEQKERILKKLRNRINKEGELIIASESYRSQSRNKQEAEKLCKELLQKALIKPKKRKPTKPTKASKERRLKEKKRKSDRNKGRGKVDPE